MATKDDQGKEKKVAEEKPKAKSGKMKWIIAGIIGLVAVAGIAAGVIFYMRSSGEEEGAEASAGKKEAAVKKTPVIYPLEPFIVNIHDGANLRYLKVKLEFEITAPEAKEELNKIQAPMRDAILVLLSSKNLEDITMTDGKNKLRDEVMATVASVASPGKVTKIYFTDFVVQ